MGSWDGLLNIILGSGIVGTFVFYTSKRRKEKAAASLIEIDVEAKRIDVDKKKFESYRDEIKHLQDQIDEMYRDKDHLQKIVDENREELAKVKEQMSKMNLELIKEREKRLAAEFNYCVVYNCEKREPKR